MPSTLLVGSSFTGSKLQIQSVVEKVAAADVSNASPGRTVCQQKGSDRKAASGKMQSETLPTKVSRRETILRSSGSALMLAFLNFAGERPDYLGVQSNPPSLALCPPTPSCISTSEELNDPTHYIPPWTYNPQDGRGRKNPASKEKAMAELIDAINTTKPDNFSPRIVKQTDDYIYVEYSSPLVGFVDDVEFWFPPGNRSLVEYRSASRTNGIDFSFNRKRIKALRQALERYGWESIGF
ncbi:hypothetical protein M758_3G186900 [Ceratodon purpureus]|uniref:DUF1499 domain-containing protein n=1 Tax=Ceratodon purpureus TaxID=3225 RepID=A0A8T0IMD3_CERPU|nr:hypothetical protein KC19_3G188100 [Ceratodon purpureus]KAG0623603.1 hypothetical protein M758_3G186900 [Ceratodon purpureus]